MRREAEAALKEAKQIEQVRRERLRHEKKALAIRVGLFKAPNVMPREMHLRRRKARERTTKKLEVATALVLQTEMRGDRPFLPFIL